MSFEFEKNGNRSSRTVPEKVRDVKKHKMKNPNL